MITATSRVAKRASCRSLSEMYADLLLPSALLIYACSSLLLRNLGGRVLRVVAVVSADTRLGALRRGGHDNRHQRRGPEGLLASLFQKRTPIFCCFLSFFINVCSFLIATRISLPSTMA